MTCPSLPEVSTSSRTEIGLRRPGLKAHPDPPSHAGLCDWEVTVWWLRAQAPEPDFPSLGLFSHGESKHGPSLGSCEERTGLSTRSIWKHAWHSRSSENTGDFYISSKWPSRASHLAKLAQVRPVKNDEVFLMDMMNTGYATGWDRPCRRKRSVVLHPNTNRAPSLCQALCWAQIQRRISPGPCPQRSPRAGVLTADGS